MIGVSRRARWAGLSQSRAGAWALGVFAGALALPAHTAEAAVDHALFDREPRTLRDAWGRIRAQCRAQSPWLRHSVRLSLSLVLGFAVMQATADPHGYWILLTIVFVSQPQYAATQTRLMQRAKGTAIGLALEQRRFPWCHRGTRCTYIAFNFGQVSLPVSRGLAVVNLGCAHMDALLAWSSASALLAFAIRYAIVRGMAQCGYFFCTTHPHVWRRCRGRSPRVKRSARPAANRAIER